MQRKIDFHKYFDMQGAGKMWSFSYQDELRVHRQFWKELHFDPGSVAVSEMNARSRAPTATMTSVAGLPLESVKAEHQDTEEVVVSTQANTRVAALALMLDSVRPRLFVPQVEQQPLRMALDTRLAPYHVAVVALGDDPDLADFRTYLTGLLEARGIRVLDCSKADFAYEMSDGHGVPYLVVVNDDTLCDGVVNVRDRETTWFEQVHAAHLSDKLQYSLCQHQ